MGGIKITWTGDARTNNSSDIRVKFPDITVANPPDAPKPHGKKSQTVADQSKSQSQYCTRKIRDDHCQYERRNSENRTEDEKAFVKRHCSLLFLHKLIGFAGARTAGLQAG